MTICRERGNIFKQSASRSFTSEISGLRKQYGMRGWRNWQTRTFEVRVVYPWGFESPPSHQKPVHIVCWFFFLCEGGDLEQGGGIYAASKATVRLCLARGSQRLGMSTKKDVARPFGLGMWWAVQNSNSNKQRQGITVAVCPAFCFASPYIVRFGSIAAYVRTWSVRTYAGKRASSDI